MPLADLYTQESNPEDYDALVERIKSEINELPNVELMSGDRLLNLWEELAFQVQVEESHCFHAYEITVGALCHGLVEELPDDLVRRLWLLSDARDEWNYENEDCELDEELGEPGIETQRAGVAEELIKKVWRAASDYDLPTYVVDDSPKGDGSGRVIVYGRPNFDYGECVERVIKEIQNFPQTSLQSGEDSPYEDAWEEYAAQVQGEESLFMGLYENLVVKACYTLVEELTQPNLLLLWQETDAAYGWCDEDPVPDTSEMQEAVAEELFKKVSGAASDYDLPEAEDEEEEDEETNDRFELKNKDYAAIRVAIDVLRLFLSQGNLPARKVVGLGKALYALERLPAVTPGIYCEYGTCYRSGDEKFSEMKYISFLITEETFEISTGGSVYDQSVGSDSISGPVWRIEIGGFADRSLGNELYELDNEIREFLNLGAEITVEDSSEEIDMDEGE